MDDKQKEIKVSVIVPTYNVEMYIGDCIESVLKQTYTNLELLCVDDGSGDKTREILQKYAELDTRVKLFFLPENKGVSCSRNKGLEKATGKYVYFLDADDYIVEHAIENLVMLAEENETDCTYFDSTLALETAGIGAPKLTFALEFMDKKIVDGQEMFATLIENNAYTGSVWRQFWLRDFLIWADVKFPEGFLAEDALFSVQAMLAGRRMMLVNQSFHVYRRHSGTMSQNMSVKKLISVFKIYCTLLQMLLREPYTERAKQALQKRCEFLLQMAGRLYFRNRDAVTEDDFTEPAHKHLFKVLLKKENVNKINIDSTMLQTIHNYKKVIVFGDGGYAMDVLQALCETGVDIFSMAVTGKREKIEYVGNTPIRWIGDLQECANQSIVVMGILKKNRAEAIRTIQQYGFKQYIELD